MNEYIWFETTATAAVKRHESKGHAANGAGETFEVCSAATCRQSRSFLHIPHPACPTCQREWVGNPPDWYHRRLSPVHSEENTP